MVILQLLLGFLVIILNGVICFEGKHFKIHVDCVDVQPGVSKSGMHSFNFVLFYIRICLFLFMTVRPG